MIHRKIQRGSRRPSGGVVLLSACALVLGGCNSLLDVTNPNNVNEENLGDAAAAAAIVNGAEYKVARGWAAASGIYADLTDEATWIGSRDAWNEIDQGSVHNLTNEFADAAFPDLASARWTADDAIQRIEGFSADGTLTDPSLLPKAYLVGAIIYATAADVYDNFALSDKQEAAPPLGEQNMFQMYETAIDYLNKAESAAKAAGKKEMETEAVAYRARVRHAEAVWKLIKPFAPGSTPANPLVADAAMVADAQHALDLAGDPNWAWTIEYTGIDGIGNPSNENGLAYNVNQRGELQIGGTYVNLSANHKTYDGVSLMDPIDNVPDPVVQTTLADFTASFKYWPVYLVSSRELHLILAENALAGGDMSTFATQINAVRAMDGLTPWTTGSSVSAKDMLIYERQANLFLRIRRLQDMYRFGIKSPEWQTSTDANQAGTLFPVPNSERDTNPCWNGSC